MYISHQQINDYSFDYQQQEYTSMKSPFFRRFGLYLYGKEMCVRTGICFQLTGNYRQ